MPRSVSDRNKVNRLIRTRIVVKVPTDYGTGHIKHKSIRQLRFQFYIRRQECQLDPSGILDTLVNGFIFLLYLG